MTYTQPTQISNTRKLTYITYSIPSIDTPSISRFNGLANVTLVKSICHRIGTSRQCLRYPSSMV